jgi:hypothetical protein
LIKDFSEVYNIKIEIIEKIFEEAYRKNLLKKE